MEILEILIYKFYEIFLAIFRKKLTGNCRKNIKLRKNNKFDIEFLQILPIIFLKLSKHIQQFFINCTEFDASVQHVGLR